MIVQGIFGLAILGIFFPIMAAMQFFEKDQDLMCIPGEGLEERRNLGVCKSICSFIAIVLKLIFIGIASGATEPVFKVYDGVSDCAVDKLTKETVSFITPAVKKNTRWKPNCTKHCIHYTCILRAKLVVSAIWGL